MPSLPWTAMLVVLAALIMLAVSAPRLLDDVSNFVFDSFQRAAPRPYDPATPVRIVDIDEASLEAIGQWPWPRTRLADLINRIDAAGAAAIGLDIVLAEADRTSPENLLPLLPPGPEKTALASAISGLAGHDAAFAAAINGKPVVLGSLFTHGGGAKAPEAKFGIASAGDPAAPFLMSFSGVVAPLASFQAAAAGIGALNWAPDRDLVVRRAPIMLALNGTVYPSLAAELLRVAQGASTFVLRASNASGETAFGEPTGLNAVKIGDLEIPTSPRGDVRVRYSATEPGRFISATGILAGTTDPAELQGRIILIGSSAAGLADLRATPLDPSVPGVEVHAQLLEHMLEGRALSRPDWAPAAEWLVTILLSLLLGVVAIHFSPLIGALLGAIAVVALWAASWFCFSRADLLLDPLFPTLSSGLVYLAGVITLFRSEQNRRLAVRNAFARFVSPDVVQAIAETPELLKLGGEIRPLTLMFTDVRNFTALAEGRDAEDLTRFMNSYLAPMTEIILSSRGTLDKYMGDAIMAFWNAPLDDPDHARHAIDAALAMLKRLDALNQSWQEQAKATGKDHKPMMIGIGISTGEGCVGNFGSEHRFDYSVLGDQVNIASRLESLTKRYKLPVIVSDTTRSAVPDCAFLPLDRVRLKGKSAETALFALIGDRFMVQNSSFQSWAAAHQAVRDAIERGAISEALAALDAAKQQAFPGFEFLYELWREEWTALPQRGAKDWSPVLDMLGKY